MPCPFYLEAFGLMPESLLYPIEHLHASRHFQHLSPSVLPCLSQLPWSSEGIEMSWR